MWPQAFMTMMLMERIYWLDDPCGTFPVNALAGVWVRHFNDMITIILRLSIYASVKHALLLLKHLELVLNSLDTLSDIRIKVFTLLF